MTIPAFETLAQQWLFAKLNGNISATVYDDVPQLDEGVPDAIFPYIAIGADNGTDWDLDDKWGREINCMIHIWSRDEGFKETKAVMGEITNLLHRQNGAEVGYHVVDCIGDFNHTTLEPDRRTRHGVMQFRLRLTDVT